MVKVAARYFLSLCILLLSGYGYLSAHAVHDSFAADASAQQQTHFNIIHNHAANPGILTSSTEREKSKDPIEFAEEEEVEENKESSSKKLLEISDFYVVLLDTKQALFYSHFIKSRLLFYERSSYYSSEEPLNIELGVFLI
ncbi:hypothetical protein [Fulvivirga lutimaris]|uniref:hypothetical protein n=1 Tax=Fulvivirga lutimaris TaxID=1819566 RepID=UPI0012BCE292|nr:hypothetical protein [Fulvivirga lutimaris]MTI41807.1 hypothetical protein [Fulvivirga lutimaris]